MLAERAWQYSGNSQEELGSKVKGGGNKLAVFGRWREVAARK